MLSSVGKRLADTDPVIRSRSFKKLRNICKKPVTDYSELLRLWRGLWYALWMADKRVNQTAVAVEAVQLGQAYSDADYTLWTRAFFETLISMWSRLDKWRMDKFLLLVRVFVAETFRRLHLSSWNETMIGNFNKEMCMLSTRCLGATMHIARVFWEELEAEISCVEDSEPVSMKTFIGLLDGMVEIASTSNFQALVRRECEDVLLDHRFPKKLVQMVVKKLRTKALAQDIDQEIREILCDTVERL